MLALAKRFSTIGRKKISIVLITLLMTTMFFADSCMAGQEECGTCNGSGKCNRCDGTGRAIDWDLECDKCSGTGDCQTCDGTGYIDTGVGGTGIPSFELLTVISAMAVVLFWRRKRK